MKAAAALACALFALAYVYARAQVSPGFPSANTIYAGPSSGSPGAPSFRTLTPADVPGSTLNYCLIDGITFASTIAGIQSAINSSSCSDIYIPHGTYNGSAQLTIARSNLRLHGAGGITSPQGISTGTTASTILNFTCFGGTLAPAIVVGDTNPALTYGGIDISDFEVVLPSACNMVGIEIKPSTPDSGNMIRRVRVTELTGNTVGAAIELDQLVYSWRFEDVIVDHFFDGYLFKGQNHFTQIIGGQVRNNQVGFNVETSGSQSSNIIVSNVDIEGNTGYAFDIWEAAGFTIRDNYIDSGTLSTTEAIRISSNTHTVEGLIIEGNYFNNCCSANYAIEIAANAFVGLTIIGNHFNNYGTANILNNATAANVVKAGVFLGNDNFGTPLDMTGYTGFKVNDTFFGTGTTVAKLPTCDFVMSGARYFVIDQNTSVAYKGAVTGGGATGQAVNCDGSNWYQD